MKKIKFSLAVFLTAAISLGFIACSSDDSDNPEPFSLFKEFNINIEGLVDQNFVMPEELDRVIFYGRLNGKLWIGCYKNSNRERLLEWTSPNKIEEYIEVEEMGNIIKAKVTGIQITAWTDADNSFTFNLHRESDGVAIANDLYFVNNGKFANKISHEYTYPKNRSWYNGSIFADLYVYACYDANGNKLYDLKASLPHDSTGAINEWEHILFSRDKIVRRNLETGETTYSIDSPLKDIPSNSKEDSVKLKKNNSIWTYTFNYTLQHGTKVERTYELNIETGEYKQL